MKVRKQIHLMLKKNDGCVHEVCMSDVDFMEQIVHHRKLRITNSGTYSADMVNHQPKNIQMKKLFYGETLKLGASIIYWKEEHDKICFVAVFPHLFNIHKDFFTQAADESNSNMHKIQAFLGGTHKKSTLELLEEFVYSNMDDSSIKDIINMAIL